MKRTKHINLPITDSKVDYSAQLDKLIAAENDKTVNAIIAMKLFDYMEEMSMSRKQLAERLEISTQYLSRLLGGYVNITVNKAIQYGDKLNIKLVVISEDSYQRVEPASRQKYRLNGVEMGVVQFNPKISDKYLSLS